MRNIVKLIFRFDFLCNYEVMDRPGKTLQSLLQSVPDNFWNNAAESAQNRSIRAFYSDRNLYRIATIEPTTINGVMEIPQGIEFDKILENETFRTYDKILANFFDAFGTPEIERGGLRVFLFENYGEKFANPVEKFRSVMNKPFLESFNKDIGEIKDAGVIFEGETKDSLNFRIHFGHFSENDVPRIINHVMPTDDVMDLLNKNHVTADIDIWEKSFSFKGLTLSKWTRDKWPLINDFMSNYKKSMLEN